MKGKNINTKIEAQNIGPHENLSASFPMSALKIGIFANNGSGKTFLSRMFRLINVNVADKSNKLLALNKNSGTFSFQIKEKKETGEITKTLSIKLQKDKEPIINNDTGYIFHVFNSDYVKENIEELQYRADGEIEGYILGKAIIDLTKEKKVLEDLKISIGTESSVFKEAVDAAKLELDSEKVSKATKEYKFDYKNVYNNDLDFLEEKTFNELKKLSKLLSKIPEDLKDIPQIIYNSKGVFFTDLVTLFNTKYSKSSIAEDFKKKIVAKQEFVELGIKLINSSNDCPFCEQNLEVDAIALIDKYNEYLSDSEAKVRAQIKKINQLLTSLEKEFVNDNSLFLKSNNEFNSIKKYIPSDSETELIVVPDHKHLTDEFKTLLQLLEKKKNNIELVIDEKEYETSIEAIKKQIKNLENNANDNNFKIISINDKRNNISSEKLNINRRLCKARYIALQDEQKKQIKKIKDLFIKRKELEKQISDKESQEKVSKKDRVLESLKMYLNNFFGDKYSLDEDSFCLKFNKQLLENNATDVLSDGEKSIVAFCYYLADMHKVVSKDEDYKKLFFIIDDPISSLDFHYVYSVSQIIRNLHTSLKLERTRFLIFTHNLEFMSILIRNKIINERLILSNNKMSVLSRELVMPYEEHLRDIYGVSNGNKPSHTTPNSVRHVLETINKFESPNLDLKDYCEKKEVLSKNEFIYSLMHDGSHGIIRQQVAYTDDMIKKGCDVIVAFVKDKFEGQILQIEI